MIINGCAQLENGNIIHHSNIAIAKVEPSISIQKLFITSMFKPGSDIFCQIQINNHSTRNYNSAEILDNLGKYLWRDLTRTPLKYVYESARLQIINEMGTIISHVNTIESSQGLKFIINIPARSAVLLVYCVRCTNFAPLAVGSTIRTTTTLKTSSYSSICSNIIYVDKYDDLQLSKYITGNNFTLGKQLDLTYTITNYGNQCPINSLELTDIFYPTLSNLNVVTDGVTWIEGEDYQYDINTGLFQTKLSSIVINPATFEQDKYGQWNILPSTHYICINGTIEYAKPPQPVINIYLAYSNIAIEYYSVVKLSNTVFRLKTRKDIQAKFIITSTQLCKINLEDSSDNRVNLTDDILTIDNTCLDTEISASLLVNYDNTLLTLKVYYSTDSHCE